MDCAVSSEIMVHFVKDEKQFRITRMAWCSRFSISIAIVMPGPGAFDVVENVSASFGRVSRVTHCWQFWWTDATTSSISRAK